MQWRSKLLSLNNDIYDWAIHHNVYTQRLAGGEAKRMNAYMGKYVWPDVEGRIRRIDLVSRGQDAFGFKGITGAKSDIGKLLRSSFRGARKDLESRLKRIGNYEASTLASRMGQLFPIKISLNLPSSGVISQLVEESPFEGHLLKDWFNGLTVKAQSGANAVINQGMIQGHSIDQMVTNLYSGPARIVDQNADMIVRTAVNAISSQARERTYAENLDIVGEVMWVSTLDARTTIICMSRDGKRYPVMEGPRPPAHIGCRSTTVPITKSWEELGIPGLKELDETTRATMDGQKPDKVTYEDWLKAKPASFQNEVLGPKRAELFREQGLSLKDMVNASTGKTLTIDQLEKK